MFSFAALVVHSYVASASPGSSGQDNIPTNSSVLSIFRTSLKDATVNDTSSYVDLAPLYGANQEEQDKVRIRDGRGLLVPDSFAEHRLLLLPRPVSVLLILFNRNHNARALLFLPYCPKSHLLPATHPVHRQEALGDQ